MTTLLLSHRASLDHLTPPGHPERPDRIRAVDQVLAEDRFDRLVRGEAPEGSLDSVTLCHNEHYVGELRHIAPSCGLRAITPKSASRWDFAFSITPRLPRVTPSANTASAAPRWSISTSITATAPRTFSGPTQR